MSKFIILSLSLFMSFSTLASVSLCSGEVSETIILCNNDFSSPNYGACSYSFKEKDLSVKFISRSVREDMEKQEVLFINEFTVKEKHNGLARNSKLRLEVVEKGSFQTGKLYLIKGDVKRELEKMDCALAPAIN